MRFWYPYDYLMITGMHILLWKNCIANWKLRCLELFSPTDLRNGIYVFFVSCPTLLQLWTLLVYMICSIKDVHSPGHFLVILEEPIGTSSWLPYDWLLCQQILLPTWILIIHIYHAFCPWCQSCFCTFSICSYLTIWDALPNNHIKRS